MIYCSLNYQKSLKFYSFLRNRRENGGKFRYLHKYKQIQQNGSDIVSKPFFNGCGGRTRTCDLRVMSPTSYQLLYSAIFNFCLRIDHCLMSPTSYQLLYLAIYYIYASLKSAYIFYHKLQEMSSIPFHKPYVIIPQNQLLFLQLI